MTGKTTEDRRTDLEDRSREAFRESVDALDAATLSRLNRARQQALAELAPAGSALGNWIPIGVTAALAVMAVAVWVNQGGEPGSQDLGVGMAATDADDLALVLEGEELDMLAELEFYDWVGTESELEGEIGGTGNIG